MRSQSLSGPPMEQLLVSVVYVHVALIMLISSNRLRAHAVSFLEVFCQQSAIQSLHGYKLLWAICL